jgi:hypothetical protein
MVDQLDSSIIVERTIVSGQYHIESENDEDVSITILNEPPIIEVGEVRTVEVGDDDVEYTLTISVSDYDGLNWVKVNLGNLAPPGKSNTWYTMTSNGDGTYSKQFTVKSHIALGTHELLVKAMDSYGSQSASASVPIILQEPGGSALADESASSLLTYFALGGLGILVIAGAAIYVMRGSEKEGGLGGFGDA